MIEDDEPYACPICDVAFAPADLCSIDLDLGACHVECLDGAPVVDLDTGDELPEGTPVLTFRYDSMAPPSA